MVGAITSTTSSTSSVSSSKDASAALEAQLTAKQAELSAAKTDDDKKKINDEITKIKAQIAALKATDKSDKQDSTQAAKTGGKSASGQTVDVTAADKAAPESKVPGAVMDVLMKMRPGGGMPDEDGEGHGDPSKLYADMDADDDGKLSKTEFVSANANRMSEEDASKLFDSMDSAKTGSITEDQFASGMKPPEGGRPPMGPPPGGFNPMGMNAQQTSSSGSTNT